MVHEILHPQSSPILLQTYHVYIYVYIMYTWQTMIFEILTPNRKLIDFGFGVEISTPEWFYPFEPF